MILSIIPNQIICDDVTADISKNSNSVTCNDYPDSSKKEQLSCYRR